MEGSPYKMCIKTNYKYVNITDYMKQFRKGKEIL